jgi:hypothetical protein
MFLENKYHVWYRQIMACAKARGLIELAERHHILPRSLGGNDLEENIVVLTYREHFLAHWLLTKFTTGKAKRSMFYALTALALTKLGRIVAGWQYEKAKMAMSQARKGAVMSEETRRLLSIINTENPSRPMLGRTHSESARSRISVARKAAGNSPETNRKISLALIGNQYRKGRKHSLETRAQMSASKIGNQNRTGTKQSEEAKRKIGEASRRYHEARRAAKRAQEQPEQ